MVQLLRLLEPQTTTLSGLQGSAPLRNNKRKGWMPDTHTHTHAFPCSAFFMLRCCQGNHPSAPLGGPNWVKPAPNLSELGPMSVEFGPIPASILPISVKAAPTSVGIRSWPDVAPKLADSRPKFVEVRKEAPLSRSWTAGLPPQRRSCKKDAPKFGA